MRENIYFFSRFMMIIYFICTWNFFATDLDIVVITVLLKGTQVLA